MVSRLVLCASLLLTAGTASAAEFVRGFNLNGPAVTIDGRAWEPGDAKGLTVQAAAFANQAVPLVPATDSARAEMIRSSRWGGAAEFRLTDLPAGRYAVFLYVWEDNDSERFAVLLNGREVLKGYDSGSAGTWRRLGPFVADADGGTLRLATRGGAANVSGIELWRGDGPIPDPTSPPKPRDSAAAKHFDAAIAPLLSKHCVECHNGSDAKGGLDLSNEAKAVVGGEGGGAFVAGKPEDSPLWQYVEADEMPKDRPPLSAGEKELLKAWIAGGAEWGTPTIDPFLTSTDRRAGYDFWSLQPVREVPPPVVKNARAANPIDAFVFSRLEAAGLSPAAEADRRTLIRRVTFDLTGLPPEPEAVAAFTSDPDPLAYEKLVDRLLASPRYGERWGRHWLDVIRFGESQGFERNRVRENAWRYRDWVVDAFNADLPYAEFVRRQIAGDVLAPNDPASVVATGYHVCGTWDQVAHNEGSGEMRKAARQDEIEDLVGTLGQSFLGLTVNCARCHDHKVDPVLQADYYRVAALLSGVRQKVKERENVAGLPAAHVPYSEQPSLTYVLDRGDHRNPKALVTPAGIKAVAGPDPDFGLSPDASDADRRTKLAEWIVDPANPLAARVFVNRLWHHHFGTGLVDTPSDFGFNGGRPSHPELLDFLAARFATDGGRAKDVQRLILTSATYRQDSRVRNSAAEAVDADDRLLWRFPLRRLEGEAVRDAMLVVSGTLNPAVGGPSYRDMKFNGGAMGTNAEFTDPTGEFGPAVNRRTLYRLWARSGNNPLLETLDCPDPSVLSPKRTRTITPIQALSLLNGPFAERCAEELAGRVRRESSADPVAQIERAYRLTLNRPPKPAEADLAGKFVAKRGLEQFCLVLLNTNEFLYLN